MKFLRLFLIRLGVCALAILCVVSFYWAYVWEFVVWHKTFWDAFSVGFWNWWVFACSFLGLILLTVIEEIEREQPTPTEKKKEKPQSQPLPVETDRSVVY